MRVCMLAYSFYEDDNRVMRYAEALAQRGDEVDVIGLRKPQQPRWSFSNGVRLISIQGRVKNERRQLTYFLRIVLFFIQAFLVLAIRHIRKPYKLVHVHSMPDFLVFAALFPKWMGAKVILDIHDLTPELYAAKFSGTTGSLAYKMLCGIERASARFAHHVIAPNHLWQEKLLGRSAALPRCSVFMNLPDPSVFEPERRRKQKSEKCIVLYPGSLQWHQGVDVAVRAFSRVVRQGMNAEFHIYGEGQAKPSLINLIQELGMQQSIFMHDGVSLRQIADIMKAADIGVVPKRGDTFGNEAFSTKILEFMACGVPVIAADTKIDLYYFKNDVITFFKSGSESDLSAHMLQLLTSQQKRSRQAAAAEELVNRSFNWEKARAKYLELVDGLIAGHSDTEVHASSCEAEYTQYAGQ